MKTRSSNMGEDSKLKYISLGCSASGKNHSVARNCLHPLPSLETDFKVKVSASICLDGKWTHVVLEHNHLFKSK